MKSMICFCVFLLAVASAAPPAPETLEQCLNSLVNRTDPAVRVALLLLNELAPTGDQCENSKYAVYDLEDDDDDECDPDEDECEEYVDCDDDDDDDDNDCATTTTEDPDVEESTTDDEDEDEETTTDDGDDDDDDEPRRCLTCEGVPALKTSFLSRISEFAQLESKTDQINAVFAEMEKCLCKKYDA